MRGLAAIACTILLARLAGAPGLAAEEGIRMNELPDFDSMWNYADPQATEQAFRELLPRAEQAGERDYLAQLLTQIARAEGLQGRTEDALATLQLVDGMLDESMPIARVRYLLESGRAINGLPRPYSAEDRRAAEAKPYFQQAWDYARERGLDFYAVDAAHMLAIVSAPDEAITWQERALDLAERSSDERAGKWRGSLYNNLGWTYFEQQDYGRALELFEKGLAFRRTQQQETEVRIARWSVAKTQRMLGEVDTALATQRELLTEYEALGETDAYVYEELAECLLLREGEQAAATWFARAYETLSTDDWFMANYAERAARLRRLGGLD